MVIDVTCGVIIHKNQVLCVQRSENISLPLKWEFPGGKIEKNETAEDCLVRGIWEELKLKISIGKTLETSSYDYQNLSINLIPFIYIIASGELTLVQHKQFLWLDPSDLLSLDWAPADIPVVKEVMRQINLK
ncbi:MAG: (deoxy)nucleoside triphosphate pyrophosphohydrolase [Saprospiraceae bacterium]